MVHSTKERTESIIIANKEIVLEVNADKTKYVVILRNGNARIHRSKKCDNNDFEKLVAFKHLRKTPMNQNFIHHEFKNSLISRNVCYHSVQNFLFSSLISESKKIKIY